MLSVIFGVMGCSTGSSNNHVIEANNFTQSYSLSYMLDACGDPQSGQHLRTALIDSIGFCYADSDQKTVLLEDAQKIDRKMQPELAEYIARHGGTVERMDGHEKSCDEEHAEPAYLENKDRLDRYISGKLSLDETLENPCQSSRNPDSM